MAAKLKLKMMTGPYESVRALKEGQVQPEGIELVRMIEEPPPFEHSYRHSGGGQHGDEGGEKQQAADGDHRECIAGLAKRPKAGGATARRAYLRKVATKLEPTSPASNPSARRRRRPSGGKIA